jgi:microcystin-dependent protein
MPNYARSQTVNSRAETSYGLPIGTVLPWTAQAGTTLPVGWLLCDGSPYTQAAYQALYAAIGQGHGNGTKQKDGVTNSGLVGTAFNVPDYRGGFLRGIDNMGTGAASRDFGPRGAQNVGGSASGVGSYETDSIQGHWHVIYGNVQAARYQTHAGNYVIVNTSGASILSNCTGRAALTDPSYGTFRKGKESRPVNTAILYIIRAF